MSILSVPFHKVNSLPADPPHIHLDRSFTVLESPCEQIYNFPISVRSVECEETYLSFRDAVLSVGRCNTCAAGPK